MPHLPEHNECYGCAVCSNICPKNAIKMDINKFGEYRPVIDYSACIECNKCSKMCPVFDNPQLVNPKEAYAMTLSNDNVKNGSASGGAARLLYETAIKNGMVVFGCGFDNNFILKIYNANSIDEIEKFRNSKYTFSRMDDVYIKVKELLTNNVSVLFVGLSCQVFALKKFLKQPYENLITVDLICHGVPPEQYFIDYIKLKEKQFGKKIDKALFRSNSRKKDYHLKFYSKNKCIYDKFARKDLFFTGYVNCIFFEKKCYKCKYATIKRISDITIGDWWGKSKINKDKLSLVLLNTKKAQDFCFPLLKNPNSIWEKLDFTDVINSNEQLNNPSKIPNFYNDMREYYKKYNFEEMSKIYVKPYIRKYKMNKCKEFISKIYWTPIHYMSKLKRRILKK